MFKKTFTLNILIYISISVYSYGIIPKPEILIPKKGNFSITTNTKITYNNQGSAKLGKFLNDFLEEFCGFTIEQTDVNLPQENAIHFLLDPSFSEEEYNINITIDRVIIKGSHSGLFYGLQTLLQLMPPHQVDLITLDCMEIKDRPRFKYRGAMLDVGRYFYSVNQIKRFLDLMSYYKLNTFHWHLTEGIGWRLEIKKYPLLTKIGAWSMGTWTEPAERENLPKSFDKLPHGGYYTQRQIQEVIKYANEKYITIIPEIDTPGHTAAALKAYPDLGCDIKKNSGVLCLGKASTYEFVKDIIDEVVELFPSKIIHIGGDEANKEAWKECPSCQKMMREKDLENVDELQSYYIKQMALYIESKGKRMMGWDEILEGGDLPQNSMVMSWRGESGGITAAQKQREVVMSPNDFLYFDYFQGPKEYEPVCFAKYIPLWTVYEYEPLANIPKEYHKYILGVQANIWTQCIHDQSKLDYMTFPRLLALSEVGWSNAEKDYRNFYFRMANHFLWMDKIGVNYRVPEPLGLIDTETDKKQYIVDLVSPFEGAQIYYSIGDEQINLLEDGVLYDSPIVLDLSLDNPVTIKCVVRTPSGKLSGVRTATYKKTK